MSDLWSKLYDSYDIQYGLKEQHQNEQQELKEQQAVSSLC